MRGRVVREIVARRLQTAAFQALVERHVGEDDSNCGGWNLWGPPCGDCGNCLRMRCAHGVRDMEEWHRKARVLRHPVLFFRAVEDHLWGVA